MTSRYRIRWVAAPIWHSFMAYRDGCSSAGEQRRSDQSIEAMGGKTVGSVLRSASDNFRRYFQWANTSHEAMGGAVDRMDVSIGAGI